MNYGDLLENSFLMEQTTSECGPESRVAYLSQYVFDITTYDSEMDERFGAKAVEVCDAITNRKTFDYIDDPENYTWYLFMCNLPFFATRIEWGTSIRGAWWAPLPGKQLSLDCSGLWIGDEQVNEPMIFSCEEWEAFMRSLIVFAAKDALPPPPTVK